MSDEINLEGPDVSVEQIVDDIYEKVLRAVRDAEILQTHWEDNGSIPLHLAYPDVPSEIAEGLLLDKALTRYRTEAVFNMRISHKMQTVRKFTDKVKEKLP